LGEVLENILWELADFAGERLDVVLAPCGVAHGHRSQGAAFFGGFASPPQIDLLIPSSYYLDGAFEPTKPVRLRPDEE
jgi:hypothetical protein